MNNNKDSVYSEESNESENEKENEEENEEEIFRNFDLEAQSIFKTDTLPKKSADRYMLVYNAYQKWKNEHKNSLSNESEQNNLIVYFKELEVKLKPPTLWSIWSMLKKTMNSNDNIDNSKFSNLKSIVIVLKRGP